VLVAVLVDTGISTTGSVVEAGPTGIIGAYGSKTFTTLVLVAKFIAPS
jgi:hypothetical protein